MARAATSPELALFRTHGQWCKLKLFIYTPPTVYSARVTTLPTSNDQVRAISYGSGSGTIGDVLADMTLMVGTTAGGWDKGFARVTSIDGSKIYIGETSEIVWAANQYLTIVDDFEIWLRKLSFLGGTYNLDNEIPYTDQYTNMLPEPVLGPYLAVIKLTAATVTLAMDAGGSWVPGGTITGYAWSAHGPASVSFSSTSVANPTLTFGTAGTYRIACTVSTATRSNTGYRLVHVHSDAHPLSEGFVPGKIDVSRDDGGSFTLEIYDPALLSGVRPRALVALVAEDHYGDTIQSIGPIPGYEPVVAIGRIANKTIPWVPEQSRVTVTVQGPAGQLQTTPNWPFTLMDTNAVKPGASPMSADWLHMPGLTADKALWCWANWRSTMSRCMDVYPSGDTRRAFAASGNLGSSWEQIKAFADQIGALPLCDRYGRLFMQIDPNLLSSSARAALPVVMEITKADWSEEIDLERREVAATAWLQTAGYYFNGSTFETMLSAAPGNAMGIRGGTLTKNNLLFTTQALANELTGRLLTRANNEYPTGTIPLAANNRLIDIAPQQYVTLTLGATDTPLGVSFTARKFIPRRVTYTYDTENGMLSAVLEAEAETFDGPAVTIIPPAPGIKNIVGGGKTPNPWGGGTYPPWNPYVNPPKITRPPTIPPNTACLSADQPTGPYNLWITGVIPGDFIDTYGTLPSTIRASSSGNKSTFEINGVFYKKVGGVWVETLEYGQFEVFGADAGGHPLATATNLEPTTSTQRSGVFAPIGNTPVDQYRIRAKNSGYTSPLITSAALRMEGAFQDMTVTYDTVTQETAPNGSTHITLDWQYSCKGYFPGGYDYALHDCYLAPGLTFLIPIADIGTPLKVRLEMSFVMNPAAGGTTDWSTPTWIAAQSFFWQRRLEDGTPVFSGDDIVMGDWIITPVIGQQYGEELKINLVQRHGYNPGFQELFSGSVNINAWISRDDAQEYQTVINSAFIRNVCPV